jgi:hypothetical protein
LGGTVLGFIAGMFSAVADAGLEGRWPTGSEIAEGAIVGGLFGGTGGFGEYATSGALSGGLGASKNPAVAAAVDKGAEYVYDFILGVIAEWSQQSNAQ